MVPYLTRHCATTFMVTALRWRSADCAVNSRTSPYRKRTRGDALSRGSGGLTLAIGGERAPGQRVGAGQQRSSDSCCGGRKQEPTGWCLRRQHTAVHLERGSSPIPAKLTAKIVRGEFVDMAELLRDNLKAQRRGTQRLQEWERLNAPSMRSRTYSVGSSVLEPTRWRLQASTRPGYVSCWHTRLDRTRGQTVWGKRVAGVQYHVQTAGGWR